MKTIKLLASVALAATIAAPSFAADADGTAGAEIVAPLQVSSVTNLHFGTITPSLTAADTVIVSAAGAKTCGAELTCLTENHAAAQFDVTGEADNTYTITLPTSISITNGSGGSMTVDTFTGSQASGTLTAGADSFTVGGTLGVSLTKQ